jgi:hypothetical protein
LATRDWDILEAARDLLVATGEFNAVYRAALPEVRGRSAADAIAAVLALASWQEVDRMDDPGEVQSERTVTWTLTLIVREDDAELRERTLDRLLAVAQDALDGQRLADVTIPGWTRLRSGKYETATPPEQRMSVTGEFRYWIEGFEGHDTSE